MKGLHSKFGRGAVAILKTPNFALDPDDIPGVGDGMPSNRITLQYLEPPTGIFEIPPVDAVLTGTPQARDGNAPPPALLLDFMYGGAAYKRWGNGPEMQRALHAKFVDDYQSIPVVQKPVYPSNDENSGLSNLRQPQGSLDDAIDEMNTVMMYLSGTTPEMRMANGGRRRRRSSRRAKHLVGRKSRNGWSNLIQSSWSFGNLNPA